MGQVSRDEVDIIISDCLMSYTRTQVVQSSTFYDRDFLGWVSPNPAPQPKYFTLIAPFNLLIWLLIGFSMLFIATVLWIISNLESWVKGIYIGWGVLGDYLWYCFGSLLGESINRDIISYTAPAMRYYFY